MANEITINASLAYEDSEDTEVSLAPVNKEVTITTKLVSRLKQSIGFAAEEAINLGQVANLGYAMFVNRDVTNYVELKVATSGAIFAKLFPGECALLRLGSGAQAPFAIANTAAVQLDTLILSV